MVIEHPENNGRIDDDFIQGITNTNARQKERENKLITNGINESRTQEEDENRPAVVAGQYKLVGQDAASLSAVSNQMAIMADLLRNNIEVMTRNNAMPIGNLGEHSDSKHASSADEEAHRLVVEVLRQIGSRDIFRKICKWMEDNRYSEAQIGLVSTVLDISKPKKKASSSEKKKLLAKKDLSSPEASGKSDNEDANLMHTEPLAQDSPLPEAPVPPLQDNPPLGPALQAPADSKAMDQEAVGKEEDEETVNLRKLETYNKERLKGIDRILFESQPAPQRGLEIAESLKPAQPAETSGSRLAKEDLSGFKPITLLLQKPNPKKHGSQDGEDTRPPLLPPTSANTPPSNPVIRKEPLKAPPKPDQKPKMNEVKPAVEKEKTAKLDKAAFEQKYGSITLPEKKKKMPLDTDNKRAATSLLSELICDIDGNSHSKQQPKKKQSPKKAANGNTFSDEDSSKSGGNWSDEERSRSREKSPSRKKPSIVLESLTPQETRRFNRLESLTRPSADPFLQPVNPTDDPYGPIEPLPFFEPPET